MVRFAERRNLFFSRVSSHFNWSVPCGRPVCAVAVVVPPSLFSTSLHPCLFHRLLIRVLLFVSGKWPLRFVTVGTLCQTDWPQEMVSQNVCCTDRSGLTVEPSAGLQWCLMHSVTVRTGEVFVVSKQLDGCVYCGRIASFSLMVR